MLTTRETQNGSSTATLSLNGSPPRALFYGSTVNVRILSPRNSHRSDGDSTQQRALERASFRMCHFFIPALKLLRLLISSTIIEDILGLRKTGMGTFTFFYFDFKDTWKQAA